ncbi:MAG: hypothetical protein AB1625_06780, partial [Acidobacteriota bacterium]
MRAKRILPASVALTLLPLASALAGLEQLKFRPAVAAAAAEARLGLRIGFSCVPQPASASVRVQLSHLLRGLSLPPGTTAGFRYTKGETINRGGVQQPVTVQVEVETELTSAWASDQAREWAAPGIVQGPCNGWYYGGWPDLEVSDFNHQQGQFTIVVRNKNPLVPAYATTARIAKGVSVNRLTSKRTEPRFAPGGRAWREHDPGRCRTSFGRGWRR